jgi:hypothetical protein
MLSSFVERAAEKFRPVGLHQDLSLSPCGDWRRFHCEESLHRPGIYIRRGVITLLSVCCI